MLYFFIQVQETILFNGDVKFMLVLWIVIRVGKKTQNLKFESDFLALFQKSPENLEIFELVTLDLHSDADFNSESQDS